MRFKGSLLLFLIVSSLIGACSMNRPHPGAQVWIDNGYTSSVVDGYWLYLPENMDKNKLYPLILFLQGGYGSSPIPRTSKEDGPAKYAMAMLKNSELAAYVKDSFLIINPHMTPGPSEQRQWAQYDKTLLRIVDEVVASHQGDDQRIYLTGLSRGGHGSWGLLKKHPERFTAVVSISGRITCRSNCESIRDIPVWIVHNNGDDVVDFKYARNTVNYMEAELGLDFLELQDVRLKEGELNHDKILSALPHEGHDAWNYAYASPDLYRWMLFRKLTNKKSDRAEISRKDRERFQN